MIALDTNLLAYAAGLMLAPTDADKGRRVTALLRRVQRGQIVVPVQALAELHWVLRRKGRLPAPDASGIISGWTKLAHVVPSTPSTLAAGLGLCERHNLQTFDALILAAAAEAGCRFLLSEDMQPGLAHAGCTVANPLAEPWPAELDALLAR